MINIQRKEDCCGCGACYDACAKSAIIWETDDEGFSYPHVDTTKCVDCGLCNKVCPIENSETINHYNDNFTPIVLAAYHKDEDIRFTSTSGGAFWGLAEPWVKNGGYVAGAIFSDHFKVRHIVTNSYDELLKIKGSKYCQSDSRGIYKRIAELLKKGEKVLATGLPCQMAGLRQYLRKDYENLLIVDLICHSVTSQLAFDKYVAFLERKYGSRMLTYHPKNKEYGGWHDFAFKAVFSNGKVYAKNGCNDYFTTIFVGSKNLLSRYSCYECHYKHYPQPSDITIGDFWGIEKIDPSFDSPKGVSKIVLNNARGKEYIERLTDFECKEYGAEESIFSNPRSFSMIKPVDRPDFKKRKLFVRDLNEMEFESCMVKHFMPQQSIKQRIKKYIKTIWLYLK